MALSPPAKLAPPVAQPPLLDGGTQFAHAWAQHNQDIVDRLFALPGEGRRGVVDGSDAAAGEIGELFTVTSGSIAMPSATWVNVATLALPAGDWTVEGNITFTPAGNTVPTRLVASVSDVSATLGPVATDMFGMAAIISTILTSTFQFGQPQTFGTGGTMRRSLAAPGFAYLVGRAVYFLSATLAAGGSLAAVGTLRARRMR
jgi:hypothetical protein